MSNSNYLCVAYGGSCAQCPPGHTMESLRKAIEIGGNALYIEVRMTQDEELVAWPSLQRLVMDSAVSLLDHTLSEWRDLTAEFGPRIVSLDEVLELTASTRTGLFIDVRVSGQENALAKKLRASGISLDDIWITSPSESVRVILRSLDRRISIAHRFQNDTHAKLSADLLNNLDSDAVIWPPSLLNPQITTLLKNAGVAVYGGPSVLVQEMRRLRDECGVDGIITPYPDFFLTHANGLRDVPGHVNPVVA